MQSGFLQFSFLLHSVGALRPPPAGPSIVFINTGQVKPCTRHNLSQQIEHFMKCLASAPSSTTCAARRRRESSSPASSDLGFFCERAFSTLVCMEPVPSLHPPPCIRGVVAVIRQIDPTHPSHRLIKTDHK